MNVRTRIAPSPTGFPHIGTIYQALFDYSYAKKNKGKFVVRIEDTDQTRFVAGAEDKIYNALDWFGLTEDESPRKGGSYAPYRQSERLGLYQKYAIELIEKGHAYYCFCTKERLSDVRKKQQEEKKMPMYDKLCSNISAQEKDNKLKTNTPYVIRLKIPENTIITFTDQIRGKIAFDSNTIDDQVLLKSDGFPTYHLAVVVDDHLMKISHIVRAEEWLPSTPKHVIIYQFLGWNIPLIFHTATLRNPDKSKLSKRHGHTNIDWYRENGYLPEAILNYLAHLGWTHPKNKEIFSLDEFVDLFNLKDIRPIAPIFDITKLTWINQQYIQHLSDEDLKNRLMSFWQAIPIQSGERLQNQKIDAGRASMTLAQKDKPLLSQLLPLVRERMQTLKDFEILTGHFFKEPEIKITDNKEMEIAEYLLNQLSDIKDWNKESIFSTMKNTLSKFSIRMPILYKLLTGNEKGLPLPESLEILGKEKILARINKQITQ
jgi:glutamyl-tRNA synthetase